MTTFIFELDEKRRVSIQAKNVTEAMETLRKTEMFQTFTYIGRGRKR